MPAAYGVVFSPNGRTVASMSILSSAIQRWDVSTGKKIEQTRDHTGSVRPIRFSPDGKTLFSGSVDRTVQEWDLTSFQNRGHTFDSPLGPVAQGLTCYF